MESKTISLTDEIYGELVDGLKTGELASKLEWTAFIAKRSASKGPLYNAIDRFFHDMGPKIQELNEVQASLDQAGIRLDQLDREISEADKAIQAKNHDLALLEEKENTLKKQTEVLQDNLEQQSAPLERLQKLDDLGFGEERLKVLTATLAEMGTKRGLKRDESVNTFFAELKDYDAIQGFTQELQRLETIIRTKTLEAERFQAEANNLSRRHKDLSEAITAVESLIKHGVKTEQIVTWNGIVSKLGGPEALQDKLERYYGILKACGFDEKALGELTKAAEKYGTPRKVLRAVNWFGDLSKIKATDDKLRNKVKQKRQLVKRLDEEYSHLREPIEICKRLVKRKFGLRALQLINITARRYGEPTEVMKATEAYGALKEIKKETDRAKIALAEIEGKIEVLKETYAEQNARNIAMLDQFEILNAKAIETGCIVGGVQEQLKKDALARDLLTLLHNPSSASYEEYAPLVLVLLRGVTVWAIMNRTKFSYPSLIDKNLQEVVGYLGGS
ncbi:hypothetical protein ES703_42248 [subsurface metagenome]